jgi:catechol 2,3-dioxygenase-like lactoylglutathione lyase family enzyme
MNRAGIDGIAPFFIVSSVDQTIAYYRDRLGFAVVHRTPDQDPFFAIVARDQAMLLVKSGEVSPVPNCRRHPEMRWDAYVSVLEPDGLAAELRERGVLFSSPLQDTQDGLRGFEITDPDGHVLFFGRPR